MNGRRSDEELTAILRAVVQNGSVPPTDEQRRAMWPKIVEACAEERIYGSDVFLHPLAIDRTREMADGSTSRMHPVRRSMWWAASAAALLAAGIIIGVSIRPSITHQNAVVASAATRANMAQITADHFAASQQLLMTVAERGNGSDASISDAELVTRARSLLSTTQILLDTPAGLDASRRHLLSDLELELVQIVQLAPEPEAGDRELMARAIAGRRMIPRLQSAMPPGATWGT